MRLHSSSSITILSVLAISLVRHAAILALADLGGPALADDLFARREDEDMGVRHDVAFALSRLGDPRGAPLLAQVLAAAKEFAGCPDCGEFYPIWEEAVQGETGDRPSEGTRYARAEECRVLP